MSHKHRSLLKVFQNLVSTRPGEKVILVPNGAEYEEIKFQDLDLIINKYVNYWNKQLENENLKKNSVIGYLSQSGPEYLYNIMALWKLGFTILFLSPRNSETALIHLIQEAKSRIIIYDPKLLKTSKNVQNEINSQYTQTLNIFQQPNNLKNEQINHFAPVLKLNDPENTIAIFHSSGSISFSKLIPISRFIFNMDAIEKADDIIVSTAPIFHAYGVIVLIRVIVNPGHFQSSQDQFLYIEQIHKDRPDEINALLKLKAIHYVGAPLSPKVGEQLTQSGVKIHNAYELIEAGTIINDIVDGAKELVIKKGSPNLAFIKGEMENDDYKIDDLNSKREKTNPIPIEDTIRYNEFVKHAVIVGHNRPFNCNIFNPS
ncbi:10455_t:CDS:2 [Dentiscutata erythropus]|uniref:10455_t:CDS:1 n=1 Tax=Dentiscutata erythropus TaxID=1348616 RepID=A0A9N9JSF2_9GLOM|nr:10455_t:CDS:2 [Dentiscutata erythropus]